MKRKKHKTQELIRKQREAEAMSASGQTAAAICKQLEVSEGTLNRRRKQCCGMGDADIKRMRALEEENRRLKKAAADPTLDKQILKEAVEGKD